MQGNHAGKHARTAVGCTLAVLLLGLPAWVQASGARQGVKPNPGEIVLLRDVSTRPAYRPAPPGMALIVDPSPKRELLGVLGVRTSNGMDELSDDDYAAMDAGVAEQGTAHATTVGQVTDRALNGALGGTLGKDGMLSGQGLGKTIGGSMSAVGNATRGIGSQVTSALSQMPLAQPPGGK